MILSEIGPSVNEEENDEDDDDILPDRDYDFLSHRNNYTNEQN